jgi:hypothetical protein
LGLLAVYTKKPMIKMGLRPYCSDKGPHKRGPTQYPATKMDIVSMPTSPEKPNCCMSWGTIPEGAELANVLRLNIIISKKSADIYIKKDNHALRTRRAAAIVMYHLCNDDQF